VKVPSVTYRSSFLACCWQRGRRRRRCANGSSSGSHRCARRRPPNACSRRADDGGALLGHRRGRPPAFFPYSRPRSVSITFRRRKIEAPKVRRRRGETLRASAIAAPAFLDERRLGKQCLLLSRGNNPSLLTLGTRCMMAAAAAKGRPSSPAEVVEDSKAVAGASRQRKGSPRDRCWAKRG